MTYRLAEIINDIAGDADNGETRAELRDALLKWRDEKDPALIELAYQKTQRDIKRVMDIMQERFIV